MKWEQAERRSDLKEEVSDLEPVSCGGQDTRECKRERV
jgi:hypothetical protein